MKIQWCVCDMDGTLLDARNQLSTDNIQAIHELHAAGIEVILATGRSDLFIKDMVAKLGITRPVICCNGGMIRDAATGAVHFSKFIQQETARSFVADCLNSQRDLLAYSPDCIYYTRGSQRITSYQRYNNQVIEDFKVPIREFSTVNDLPSKDILKFFLSNVDDNLIILLENIHNQAGHLSMVRSQRGTLDIMANGISKGEALLTYAQKFRMDLSKTAVFGDNYNDISMFIQVGYPIAVANAEEEVKNKAQYITLSNDQSGVAYAIRNYIMSRSEFHESTNS